MSLCYNRFSSDLEARLTADKGGNVEQLRKGSFPEKGVKFPLQGKKGKAASILEAAFPFFSRVLMKV